MGSVRALHARLPEDRRLWLALLGDSPRVQPACFPSYLELFAGPDEDPMLVVYEDHGAVAVMPLLVRQIDSSAATNELRDAVGAYGYSVATWLPGKEGNAPDLWRSLGAWAESEGLVSLVCRLPVAGGWVEWPFARHAVAPNVVCQLKPWESMWTEFEHKVRKNVKKAERCGVTVTIENSCSDIEIFLDLYTRTMVRRQAKDNFRLTLGRIEALVQELGDHTAMAFAYLDGVAISTELVLIGDDVMYSFLGGTDPEHFGTRPNDLLKAELMKWAHSRGIREFVLGGGYGGEDGIFRYKKAFAPSGIREFAIGEWQLDPAAYRTLEERHRADTSGPSKGGFFPAYRA